MKMEVSSGTNEKLKQVQVEGEKIQSSCNNVKVQVGDGSTSLSQKSENGLCGSEEHALPSASEKNSKESKETKEENVPDDVSRKAEDELPANENLSITKKGETNGVVVENTEKIVVKNEAGGGEEPKVDALDVEDEKDEEEGRMVYLVKLAASLQTSLFSWLWQQLETKSVTDDTKLYEIVQTMIKECE